MNEIIHSNILKIIEEKGDFQNETTIALDSVLEYFLQQIIADLQYKHKQNEKIKPADIPVALKALSFPDTFIYNNQEIFNEYRKEQKTLKIIRLREAGFGATNEHAQFHQRILDSHHISYVRNESQEIIIGESDDASEFDSP